MVVKTKHLDGSETIIKSGPSRSYKDSSLTEIVKERHKYSVIISSSVGCAMGCKMCGIDPGTYKYLNSTQIVTNIKEAITAYPEDLSQKYIKLCFMGMGEASLQPTNFSRVPGKIIRWAVNSGYALGVDSIDYGTILPRGFETRSLERIVALNDFIMRQYKVNPDNNHQSVVRLFFSYHSIEDRDYLIPNGKFNWEGDLWWLTNNNIDVILHYTLIDGVNDSNQEVERLRNFVKNTPYQLRMLRYNTNGIFQESQKFVEIWKYLEGLPNIKFQISPGKRKNASCGMFY